MKKISSFFIWALCLGICALAYAGQKDSPKMPFTGEIIVDKVNVRAGTSQNFETINKLKKSDKVAVFDEQYNWYKIALPNDTKCYISKNYIRKKNGKGIVDGNRVNVRARSSLNSTVITQVGEPQELTIVGEIYDWYIIAPPEGSFGWVSVDYVKFHSNTVDIQKIEQQRAVIKEPQNQPMKETQIDKPVRTSISEPLATGKLVDAGVTFDRLGKYKLIAPDKKIYYLKSQNCDFNKFLYYNVQIWGEIEKNPKRKSVVVNVTDIKTIE